MYCSGQVQSGHKKPYVHIYRTKLVLDMKYVLFLSYSNTMTY